MKIIFSTFLASFVISCCVSAERTDKCRIVQKTTLTCVEASPKDFPKVTNDKIEWILISKSKIPKITKELVGHYPKLTDLQLEKNGIEKIDKNAFSSTENLDWVDISFNELTTVDSHIFKNCPKIQYFNASGNPNLVIPKNEPFLKAPSLQWLLLQQCNIEKVYEETFDGVPGLKVLSLSGNSLSSLPPGIFRPLKNLYSLDLSKNQFTVLPVSMFQHLQYLSLYVSENPWKCDCELVPIVRWSKHGRLRDEVRCAKPDNRKWQEIANMKCGPEIEVF